MQPARAHHAGAAFLLGTVIYSASWVLPIAAPPIRDGAVAISDQGRVAWVGPAAQAPAGDRQELGYGVILPGLVNAHCHLELTHMGGGRVDPSGGFVSWVRGLVEGRSADGPEAIRASAADGIAALQACGTAAVADVSNTLCHVDLLSESGLRAVVLYELIGFDPSQAEAILERAVARCASTPRVSRVDLRLAAHAPYSVSPALLRLMTKAGALAAMHVAESPAEVDFLRDGTGEWPGFLRWRGLDPSLFTAPRTSPVAYLGALGVLRPGFLAAHCVQTDGDDHALLAREGVHVVLCPRSNRHLGVGMPDVASMIAAGVSLSLGTDSLASAGSLNVLDDAVALRREFPSIPAGRIVRMATQGGAAALGLDKALGALTPGLHGALAFTPGDAGLKNPLEFLLSGEATPRPLPA